MANTKKATSSVAEGASVPSIATETVAKTQEADKASFGEIKEVARKIDSTKDYVQVTIPSTDLFDVTHPGVQLNRHKFEAGKTYLVRGDVAREVNDRLKRFATEQVRLLRPNADRKALNDVNRGSQWSSRGGSVGALDGGLAEMGGADDKIFTVDF